ncbi:hypothetical protein J1605_010393 [Eschrichtius robustus]|uniref:Glyoxylate reductase/hydroxypyruvate reductase n=1 Tax=Eschrichtius robustus TaxID=9764 RepID=A0AB34GP50_ESCRO|nr:hypothetical protein J1605_010393 [Eschrichtius robustus]
MKFTCCQTSDKIKTCQNSSECDQSALTVGPTEEGSRPPRDHPLLELKNVTLTPHIGSATHQARRQTMENLVESILASLSGLPIPNEVLFK